MLFAQKHLRKNKTCNQKLLVKVLVRMGFTVTCLQHMNRLIDLKSQTAEHLWMSIIFSVQDDTPS